ncbi:hypothetical protein BH10BAC5_BH10BAC5_23290 [soil metagenome]
MSTVNSYHFIDYNRNGLSEFLSEIREFSNVICLDLEDGIQDINNPLNNSSLKRHSRQTIENIFKNDEFHGVKFGVRINPYLSNEFYSDIQLLSKEVMRNNLHTIFLPKVSSNNELMSFFQILNKSNIVVKEVIPIIETSRGLENLTNILSCKDGRLKKAAFGHCDLNFDLGNFPFYHQSSMQYWKWAEIIIKACESAGVNFLNSPFLELNNHIVFDNMLTKLTEKCINSFSQIVLTTVQAKSCYNFKYNQDRIFNSLKLGTNEDINKNTYAEMIVAEFEFNFVERKGFSIISGSKILISPHEYFSAKKYLASLTERKIVN